MRLFAGFALLLFAGFVAAQNPSFRGLNVGPVLTLSPTSGMTVWYSADCVTFTSSVCGTPSNASTVTTWADRSGNGKNLTLSAGTVTYNTSQINGYPALTLASAKLGLGSTISPSDQTAFVVFKATSTASKNGIFGGAAGAFYYFVNANQGVDVAACVGGSHSGTATISAGTWYQSNVSRVSSTSVTFRLNRSTDGSSSDATGSATALSTMGYNGCNNTEFFGGQIAEFLYYSSALSAGNITATENYLNQKYGL
jgi:hypothetical protein